jgi:7,8-dihydroneopterin aldolase/epimerase/oxygenase
MRRKLRHSKEANSLADRIVLQGIQFYGYHGVPDAEQATGHRYEVDLALETDITAAAASDDVSQTVDYGAVARDVLTLGTTRQFRLIETLAVEIAAQILDTHSQVEAVTIRVKKLLPPVPGVVQYAAVEISRRRGE